MNELCWLKVLCSCFLFLLTSSVHAEWVRIEHVIDGDTFVVSDGTKVRIKNIPISTNFQIPVCIFPLLSKMKKNCELSILE